MMKICKDKSLYAACILMASSNSFAQYSVGDAVNLIVASAGGVVALQPAAIDRDNATPKPETAIWKTERDLIVLFENSEDRVALAILVRDASLNAANTLTLQQRFDGLKIAGHTLYRERELQDSITCFDGIIALNHSGDSTADAARMKAQIYMLLSDYENAVQAFQLCDTISRQIESVDGFHDLYRQNILGYLQAADLLGDHQLVMSLVDEILASPGKYQTSGGLDARIYALETAASSSMKSGDDQHAVSYLTTLLDAFPDYGKDFPGIRAKAIMDRLSAQGHSLAERDPEAVDAAMGIVQNSDYFGMPVWAYYVDQSARILDDIDDIESANELRMWAVNQLQIKHDSLQMSDPYVFQKQNALKKNQADLIYRTALMKQKVRQIQGATALYQTLIDDYSMVAPEYAQDAMQRVQQMQPIP